MIVIDSMLYILSSLGLFVSVLWALEMWIEGNIKGLLGYLVMFFCWAWLVRLVWVNIPLG